MLSMYLWLLNYLSFPWGPSHFGWQQSSGEAISHALLTNAHKYANSVGSLFPVRINMSHLYMLVQFTVIWKVNYLHFNAIVKRFHVEPDKLPFSPYKTHVTSHAQFEWNKMVRFNLSKSCWQTYWDRSFMQLRSRHFSLMEDLRPDESYDFHRYNIKQFRCSLANKYFWYHSDNLTMKTLTANARDRRN